MQNSAVNWILIVGALCAIGSLVLKVIGWLLP